MKTKISVLGFLLLASFASTTASAQNADVAADRELGDTEGLEKARSGYRDTWVNPNADFGSYSKLYLWGSVFEYRDVGPAQPYRSTMLRSHKREFGIAEQDRVQFEETASEVFLEELGKLKNFEIVNEIGPDTLLLRAGFLDIVSFVPPDTIGRSDVYLASFGEATFIVELIDAETGDIVAVASERRRAERPGGQIDRFSTPANRATVMAEVRRFTRRAANKLRTELDKGAERARQ